MNPKEEIIGAFAEETEAKWTKIEVLSKVFGLAAIVVYGTGFLIVNAFFSRFGVPEIASDLFRIKYFQVGLLYLAFPSVILAPIIIFLALRAHPSTRRKMPGLALINIENILLICYFFSVFAQPSDFFAHGKWIAALFLWTALTVVGGGRFSKRLRTENPIVELLGILIDRLWDSRISRISARKFRFHRKKARISSVRAAILLGIIGIDFLIIGRRTLFLVLCFVGAWLTRMISRNLSVRNSKGAFQVAAILVLLIAVSYFYIRYTAVAFFEHAAFYYLVWILICSLFWRDWHDIPRRYSTSVHNVAWAFSVLLMCGLYFLGALSFAYGVYPRIPTEKGGGNYESSPNVILHFQASGFAGTSPVAAQIPQEFVDSSDRTKSVPLKIIAETTDMVYVAPPTSQCGPIQWRLWRTPTVYGIRRDLISNSDHINVEIREL